MQSILDGIRASSKRFEGVEERLLRWINETKVQSAAEDERLHHEQKRWDALLQVFEDCGNPAREFSSTSPCDDVRRYFESHALPRPDKSAIAKRNLAKLDTIIRRQHLDLGSSSSNVQAYLGGALVLMLTALMILCAGTVTFYGCYLAWHKWGPKTSQFRRLATKKEPSLEQEKGNVAINDEAIAVISSGGDFRSAGSSVTHRSHRIAEAHVIAAKGLCGDLQKLVQNDPAFDVDKLDKANEYGSLLSAAARSGDSLTVNYVLSRKPDLELIGGRYNDAIQASAHSGNRVVLERVLEAGASETSTGGFYGSAVNAAAEKGDSEMLETLLRSPRTTKNVNQAGGTYGSPLLASSARGDLESVSILLFHGADIEMSNASGTLAIHQAAANGHLKVVELLLQRGSPLDGKSLTFGTALHAACRKCHKKVALILLQNGADPSVQDQERKTPLHIIASMGEDQCDILRAILDHHPNLKDVQDSNGNTALHLASISGNLDTAEILVAYGADCHIGDKFSAQPLFRAAGCGHAEIVQLLLQKGGADPNAADSFGRTALHGPAETNDVRVHGYLLEFGADVNAIGNDKKTPLHEACNMGKFENVELLLKQNNVKINELDNDSFPPLYKALCSSDANERYYGKCVNPDIANLLLQRDDLDVNVAYGIAVQEAARKGYVSMVRSMLHKHKADVHIQGGKYGGILQAAAISGNVELVELLLKPEYHADVNQTGGEFGSALAAAAAYGHEEVVRQLLEAGANPCLMEAGRYGSPMQSICKKVDSKRKLREGYRISIPIEKLFREYGGEEAARKVESPLEEFRWNNLTSGWGWQAPGEM